MSTQTQESQRRLPATPWGLLPPRMQVLYVTTQSRTGAWLAEAFASDSACQVKIEEACGATAGLAVLRERAFDAVLISHEPGQLDALELVDGLRAGGGQEPLIVMGQASEQEMAAQCYEAGGDAYVCVNTVTTRTLLWIVARATERHHLIRENRRQLHAEQHRMRQERGEAHRLLTEQRGLVRELGEIQGNPDSCSVEATSESSATAISRRAAAEPSAAPLGDKLQAHYRELLRAHVIMGSGNLANEMAALAESLAAVGVAAPQVLKLHTQVLEELVRGLGSRSARHVLSRADLLVLEMLVHLSEQYRMRWRNGADSPTD